MLCFFIGDYDTSFNTERSRSIHGIIVVIYIEHTSVLSEASRMQAVGLRIGIAEHPQGQKIVTGNMSVDFVKVFTAK